MVGTQGAAVGRYDIEANRQPEAGAAGGSLHITARRSGRMLVIDFADSAPGVSDEQLARLCERFYRAEGSRNRASGGSGLGFQR